MILNEYFKYIENPSKTAKARVLVLPRGNAWITLRRFCQECDNVELRLSDLITEKAWLPMPDEVFERVHDAMQTKEMSGKTVTLLGLSGYFALLTEENKRAAIVALRDWVDATSKRDAVCLLKGDECTKKILGDVFSNPRYRQGMQLIEITAKQSTPDEEPEGHTEVMLVEEEFAPLISDVDVTLQEYFRYTEEHPNDSSTHRIMVASKGRELAGLNAEVRQIVCVRCFAREFCNVDDPELSEDSLWWMCEQGKEIPNKTLPEKLKMLFFKKGDVEKHVLRVFDTLKGVEREALLWLIKQIAPKGSYLDSIVGQKEVSVDNFHSAYITGAFNRLAKATQQANERRDAIRDAGEIMADADIRRFIALCENESTSLVAPWMNCGTAIEKAELLRRCSEDHIVSNAVKAVYPEITAYLNKTTVFGDITLEEYFGEYRELKMTGHVKPEFYSKSASMSPVGVQSRDAILQQHASDEGCALLVVDAMGAEWLPMLVALAQERKQNVESIAVGQSQLPTSTAFNKIHWTDEKRRLKDIKRFDNIAHNGVEAHETRSPEENLVAALSVIGETILPRVAAGLVDFERVLVTADHGSSRLAALAWCSEPRLTKTLPNEEGVSVADWRYRERSAHGECPSEMEETLDGRFWVVRGYDRLPKKGGGQGFELHGGATLEERLVPVVVFSRTGLFEPTVSTCDQRAQIVENDDFDL